jgi:hexosaminidase
MNKPGILLFLFLITLLTGCSSVGKKVVNLPVIPLPAEIKSGFGFFCLEQNAIIIYNRNELKLQALNLSSFLKKKNINSSVVSSKSASGIKTPKIFLNLDEHCVLPLEGYYLTITRRKIIINASSLQGIFYGIQSLNQLINNSPGNRIKIPSLKIKDYPRFDWRGMHLDVSRHFMPKEFIKKYIDYLAYLKMNIFHWHLVDDQGWRIEIKKYPKLTEIGAWRDETLIGHYSNKPRKFDGKKYGGFYTQEDIKEIVAYAAERYITIVPEIEIPGHSQAAIASYPEFGCTDDKVKTRTVWGISPYVYNPSEKTIKFLEDVLDEVMSLFPSKYIHIGGDEVLKNQWEKSADVQSFMKRSGIKDENAIQAYFIKRITDYLSARGRIAIGWDEILEDSIQNNTVIMSWRGETGGIEAVRKGHNVIMTPIDYCYFDHYQFVDSIEPIAIGGFLPLDKVYSYNPVPVQLNEKESKLIMGVQGNMWTEYLDTPEKVEYMIFPRIFAIAEIQWSPQDKRSYDDFLIRVLDFQKYLDENKINYSKHCFNENLNSNFNQ